MSPIFDLNTRAAGGAQMGAQMIVSDTDVLIVIDVQNDFCPGGRLAVPGGNDVVPVINRLAPRFANIVLTQDWHPHDHFSFASMHPGKRPNDVIAAPYGPQMLWPDHCVQGTSGARISRVAVRSAGRDDPAQGISSYDRFIFGVLRERSSNTDRSYRVFAGAFADAYFSRRTRIRFLRPLLSRGCAPRRLFRACD